MVRRLRFLPIHYLRVSSANLFRQQTSGGQRIRSSRSTALKVLRERERELGAGRAKERVQWRIARDDVASQKALQLSAKVSRINQDKSNHAHFKEKAAPTKSTIILIHLSLHFPNTPPAS